jgi:predicted nucleic acid-binding protein
LIHYLRGHARAEAFLRAVPHPLRRISVVAYLELLQGARDRRELDAIRKDVRRNFVEVLPISEAISHQATRLVERHALTDGLRVADALIAATVLVRGFRLATANARHFRAVKGLKLVPFSP